MTSPRRDLIKIAEISQQAWRSLAETDPSWVGTVVWEGRRDAGDRVGAVRSQGCTGKWLKDRERAQETTGRGQAPGHGLCLMWGVQGWL